MTPILAFLEHHFGLVVARVILCLLYASIIVACFVVIGRPPTNPMRYLDMH